MVTGEQTRIDLTVSGLGKAVDPDAIVEGAALVMRAAGIDENGETATYDAQRGLFSITSPGAARGERPIWSEAGEGSHSPSADVAIPELARAVAAEALQLVCRREMRRLGLARNALPPAWATTTSFEIALMAKLEGLDLAELHAALAAKWTTADERHRHRQGKWQAGRREAQHVERSGIDGGLPNWPGMTGKLDAADGRRNAHLRLEMLDLGGLAYLSARHAYWKVSIPRELSDEEVTALGDGRNIALHIAHPYVRSRRLLINSVARTNTKTTLNLHIAKQGEETLRREGHTPIATRVRMAEPPRTLIRKAEAIARAIMGVGGLDETVILHPFGGGIGVDQVRADIVPGDEAPEPALESSRLAQTIKRSFLKHMATGNAEPWAEVARDVALLMREAGVFLGRSLMEPE